MKTAELFIFHIRSETDLEIRHHGSKVFVSRTLEMKSCIMFWRHCFFKLSMRTWACVAVRTNVKSLPPCCTNLELEGWPCEFPG